MNREQREAILFGKPVLDFTLLNGGSVFILTPVSKAAQAWAHENLHGLTQRFGSGYVVEQHYIEDILNGLYDDGLIVGNV